MQSNATTIRKPTDYETLSELFNDFYFVMQHLEHTSYDWTEGFAMIEDLQEIGTEIDNHANQNLVEDFKTKYEIEIPLAKVALHYRNDLVHDLYKEVAIYGDDDNELIPVLSKVANWDVSDIFAYPTHA